MVLTINNLIPPNTSDPNFLRNGPFKSSNLLFSDLVLLFQRKYWAIHISFCEYPQTVLWPHSWSWSNCSRKIWGFRRSKRSI